MTKSRQGSIPMRSVRVPGRRMEGPPLPAPEAKTPAVEEVKEEAVITQDMYAALRYAPSPRGARIHRGGSCHGCGLPLNRRGECDECGYMG